MPAPAGARGNEATNVRRSLLGQDHDARQLAKRLPTSSGMSYTIKTWAIEGGGIEPHLAESCRLVMAEVTLEEMCKL